MTGSCIRENLQRVVQSRWARPLWGSRLQTNGDDRYGATG